MKILIAAVLACTSGLALADKSFTAEKSGTWDCAKDASVTISRGNGRFTLKGACTNVTVNGGHNTVVVEHAANLTINGASNTITADTVETIAITGSNNKITWKQAKGGKPKVSELGQNNTVTKAK